MSSIPLPHSLLKRSTLNSDDPQTRHSARSSLELHMKKRRVDKNNIDSSFAGYCTDENGRLVEQCAVNWPKSVWIELNELCMREGLRLEMSGDEYVYISSLDNDLLLFCAINLLRSNISKASI